MDTEERIALVKDMAKRPGYWGDEVCDYEGAFASLKETLQADGFVPRYVTSQSHNMGSWHETTLEVWEINEGVFVGFFWDRGLTESQEHMYDNHELYMLDSRQVTTTEWFTV